MKTPAIYFSCYSPQKNERFPQTVIKINIIYYKIVLLSFFIGLNVIYFCCWPILLKSNLTKISKNLFTCEKRTAGISLEGESGCARGGHRPGLYIGPLPKFSLRRNIIVRILPFLVSLTEKGDSRSV